MTRIVAVVLQIGGLAAVAVGVALWTLWAGIVVGGAAAFAVGYQLEAETIGRG